MKKHALLIGMNYINTDKELYGCIIDTNKFDTILTQKYGFTTTKMTDLTNTKPTKNNIISAIDNLIKSSDKYSEIIIYYSGYGCDFETTGSCIVPLDYESSGYIDNGDIMDMVKVSKCHIKIIFDACFNGTFVALNYNYYNINENKCFSTTPNFNNNNLIIVISSYLNGNMNRNSSVSKSHNTFSIILCSLLENENNVNLNNFLETCRTLLLGSNQNIIIASNKKLNLNNFILLSNNSVQQNPQEQNKSRDRSLIKKTLFTNFQTYHVGKYFNVLK